MKLRLSILSLAIALLVLVGGVGLAQEGDSTSASEAAAGPDAVTSAVDTSFTYQGSLLDKSAPVNDICDFTFVLWDTATGGNSVGSIDRSSVAVEDGLFTVSLDYGVAAFEGDARWLEIEVDCGSGALALSPRQPLKAAPYALGLRPGATIVADQTNPALTLSNTDGYGLQISSDNKNGIYVSSAGGDGLHVNSASDDGVHVYTANDDGVYVASAGDDGLYVHQAGGDGVVVYLAGSPGTATSSALHNGIEVQGAEGNGLYVGQAGDDGVDVESVGSPSATLPSTLHNGVEVQGAEGNGLYVGQADEDGVYVDAAGVAGVHVQEAGADGVYVQEAGIDGVYVNSAGEDGVHVHSADRYGVYVLQAGNDGVDVGTVGDDGVYVYSAGDDGVDVASADGDGVYANTARTDHEWGFYTPDKIYAGTSMASNGPLLFVAQNGDEIDLEIGDVVSVSGMGAFFDQSSAPPPLVQRAGATSNAPVFGVVYSRFALSDEVEEVAGEGGAEQSIRFHADSAEGAAAPGEYVLVVVMGVAQVKVESLTDDIFPGALLATVADGGAAAPYGSIIGTAMQTPAEAQDGLIWVLVNPR